MNLSKAPGELDTKGTAVCPNTDQRWTALERKVRRLEVATVVLICLVAGLAGFLVLQKIRIPTDISARGFSMVDGAGNVLARLATTQRGGVLVLESNSGSEQVFLGVLDKAAGLGVAVGDTVRAGVMVAGDGAPSLTLRDGEGRVRLVTAVDREGLPSISLWNKESHFDFVVTPGYSPILQVFGEDGTSLLSVPPKELSKPRDPGTLRDPGTPTESNAR